MSDEIVVQMSSELSQDASGISAAASYLANLSESSRRTQAWALGVIVEMVTKEKGFSIFVFPWHQLSPPVVSLIRQNLSSYKHTTSNRILTALRGVITHCWRNGLINAETKERLIDFKPIKGSSLPAGRHVASEEIKSLRKSADPKKVVGIRNLAILSLLAGTGLRRAEVCSIDIDGYANIDGTGKSVSVIGKGNKQRTVAVPTWAQKSLDAWIETRGNAPGPLFLPLTKSGNIMYRRMDPATVAHAIKEMAEIAGIEKNLTAHDFRRTYVSNLLEAGVDLAVVQRLVGHSDPKITARYDRRGKSAERAAAEMLDDPDSK